MGIKRGGLLYVFLLFFTDSLYGQARCPLDAPVAQGGSVCPGNGANIMVVSPGNSFRWYDAPVGGNLLSSSRQYNTPALDTTTLFYVEAASDSCVSARTPVTVNVIPRPVEPDIADVTICAGNKVTLSARGPGGVYEWYSVPSGGAPFIRSPDFTTPTLLSTTTYYVQTTVGGCTSLRKPVTVYVNTVPEPPVVKAPVVCAGSAALLSASPGAGSNIRWFDFTGEYLGEGDTFLTAPLTKTSVFYAQSVAAGCGSAWMPVTVNVTAIPPGPSVSGALICAGESITLKAFAPGGDYEWYDAESGGTLLGRGALFSTGALNATTTYYVQTTISGCTSRREPVAVKVFASIPAPVSAGLRGCAGSRATLSASGSPGNYAWYDEAGTWLANGPVFQTPVLSGSTRYFVASVLGDCKSERTEVAVTVAQPVPAPLVNGVTVCPGSSARLTASGPGTIRWFSSSSGGDALAVGTSFLTPAIDAATTFYVEAGMDDCRSTRVPVSVSVTAAPADPLFLYTGDSFFTGEADPFPKINDPAGGTFTASPAGLLLDPQTGKISIRGSLDGAYTITYTSRGACPFTATKEVYINPPTGFRYDGPFCQFTGNPLPILVEGGAKGKFSVSPAGLVIDPSTGQINLEKSIPGTYVVTNTIPPQGGFAGASTSATVTINPGASVDAGPDVTVASGHPVQLQGKVKNANAVKWSGGGGTFSDPNTLNPVYTPAPGETAIVLTLSGDDPPGPCGAVADQILITVNHGVISSPATVCYNTGTTLHATASQGSIGWYDAPADGLLLQSGPDFTTAALLADRTFFVEAVVNGVASERLPVAVTVLSAARTPVVAPASVCYGTAATLSASGSDSYRWYDAASGGTLVSNEPDYVTPPLSAAVTYYVEGTLNGCRSPRVAVPVSIKPVAVVTSADALTICSGKSLDYRVTSNVADAVITWSRAAVNGISNVARDAEPSSVITESLVNTTDHNVKVVYRIVPIAGGCPGTPFDFTVTVAPLPVVTSEASQAICNNTAPDYEIKFSTGGVGFSWSRAAVPGIGNQAVTGQGASVIREVLTNLSPLPQKVVYTISYSTATCGTANFDYVVTVNPSTRITSASSGSVCTGQPQNYAIIASTESTTFTWMRGRYAGLSNPETLDRHEAVITEALVNTSSEPVIVYYKITPTIFGCTQPAFYYRVTVYPKMARPVIQSPAAVCRGTAIKLSTPAVADAVYRWTGPANFSSDLRNPEIINATSSNSGTYHLQVSVNGCTGETASIAISVTEPPQASAGPDQEVCAATEEVKLSGSITGGSGEGFWSSNGSGTFSPSARSLQAVYRPSAADRTAGTVTLTLSSTNNLGCGTASSSLKIVFQPQAVVDAGRDQDLCTQTASVQLQGSVRLASGGTWSSSGKGTFLPSTTAMNAVYIPGPGEINKGLVTLRLTSTGNGLCGPVSDEVRIRFVPPPKVNAGGTRFLFKGKTTFLVPDVNEEEVTYRWSPAVNLSNPNIKSPMLTGVADQLYTLTVTDARGCVTTDTVFVKVLDPLTIYNTFTPNGDGVNDVWNIPELERYPGPTVSIYTRYGQKVYASAGRYEPWNGKFQGEPLPAGVYYFVIETKVEGKLYSGSITLLR